MRRQSSGSRSSSDLNRPDRNPRPIGLYATNPIPSSRTAGRISSSGSRLQSEYSVGAAHVAELRRQHDAVAPVADRAADQLLVRERTVHVGRVEQVHAEVEGAVDGGDRLRVVMSPVELRHAHAAEADGGNGKG